ncbi:archaellin/type IV pilin N-terminal domain-containing protein [Halorubrum rutilum]|uniref:Flagellin n=1 Tax=Halorubrum rutilum TaxID=1364933 RepID=A0ABD6AI28_9EURY|nr:archaellin/type IV pilin N-terminal domain-containing protein [Halorubrum rutilum]
MFEKLTNEEEHGQVGIGTLIVFIAMVLVAAIAAGVLINTAGFLQTQAEATGEESTAQVTNNVDIVSATGTGGPPLTTVNLVIKKSAGSDPVDLSQVEIQYVGPSGVVTTQLDDNDNDIAFREISGGANGILESQSDRVEVELSLDGSDGFDNAGTLSAGEEADITLTTASGAQTFETLRVSDPASNPEDL